MPNMNFFQHLAIFSNSEKFKMLKNVFFSKIFFYLLVEKHHFSRFLIFQNSKNIRDVEKSACLALNISKSLQIMKGCQRMPKGVKGCHN